MYRGVVKRKNLAKQLIKSDKSKLFPSFEYPNQTNASCLA